MLGNNLQRWGSIETHLDELKDVLGPYYHNLTQMTRYLMGSPLHWTDMAPGYEQRCGSNNCSNDDIDDGIGESGQPQPEQYQQQHQPTKHFDLNTTPFDSNQVFSSDFDDFYRQLSTDSRQTSSKQSSNHHRSPQSQDPSATTTKGLSPNHLMVVLHPLPQSQHYIYP